MAFQALQAISPDVLSKMASDSTPNNPYGFVAPTGMATDALSPWYNKQTGQTYMTSSGGWTNPDPNWVQGSLPNSAGTQDAYNKFSANYATGGNPNGPAVGALGPSYMDWVNAGSPADYQGYVNATAPRPAVPPNYSVTPSVNFPAGGGLSSLVTPTPAPVAQPTPTPAPVAQPTLHNPFSLQSWGGGYTPPPPAQQNIINSVQANQPQQQRWYASQQQAQRPVTPTPGLGAIDQQRRGLGGLNALNRTGRSLPVSFVRPTFRR